MKKLFSIVVLLLVVMSMHAQTLYDEYKADTIFTFKDSRDGKKYSAFKYGDQVWMGENLRYKTKNCWCYEDKSSNCKKYGRLYDWNEAQTACPKGWHLPSNAEWDTLVERLGGDKRAGYALAFGVGLGFNIVFGWPPNVNGRYSKDNLQASFWSADANNASTAYVYYFIKDKLPLVSNNYFSKNYGMMCRCVRDNPNVGETAVQREEK